MNAPNLEHELEMPRLLECRYPSHRVVDNVDPAVRIRILDVKDKSSPEPAKELQSN